MANNKVNKYLLPTDIRMYNREEVATILNCSVVNVTMLSEVGCLKPIKIGKNYLFSYDSLKEFEKKYENCDISNRLKAIEAVKYVNSK